MASPVWPAIALVVLTAGACAPQSILHVAPARVNAMPQIPPDAAVKSKEDAIRIAKALCDGAFRDIEWRAVFYFPFWHVTGSRVPGRLDDKTFPNCGEFYIQIYTYDGSADKCRPCEPEV